MASDESYIFEALEADPEAIHEASMSRLAELLPEWRQRDTSLEVLVDRARADQTALLVDVMSDVLASIMGQVVQTVGILREMPRPATGEITVKTDGQETYRLPAGATMIGYLPDQTAVSLITTADATIPVGTSTVSGIPVETTTEGLFGGLASPQPLQPDQAYNWLESLTLDVARLGADGETDEEYLDRGSRRLRLLADQLVVPEDVAAFVRDLPGVGRVLVLDKVRVTVDNDPEDSTYPYVATPNQPRCLTVVVTGPNGADPGEGILGSVREALEARREANFEFFVIPPKYVPVTIKLRVAIWPDAWPVDDINSAAPASAAAVRERLMAWLAPGSFGARSRVTDDQRWSETSTLRIGEIVSVADAVEGIDYVDPTKVLIGGVNADKEFDVPVVALPDPGRTSIEVELEVRKP